MYIKHKAREALWTSQILVLNYKEWFIHTWFRKMKNLSFGGLSGRKKDRQRSFYHHEVVAQIVVPFLRIIGRVQFQVESWNYKANRHAHLHPCKILSCTVGGTYRERNKGSSVIDVFLLRTEDLGFQGESLLFGKPALRQEWIREGRKITWIAV